MPTLLFWILSLLMLVGALLVVVLPNPVASAMSMVVSFIGLAGLFIGLNAYFAGVIQIMVYAGAIMVLFIFIIMLLDLNEENIPKLRIGSVLCSIAVVIALIIQMIGNLSRIHDLPLPNIAYTQAAMTYEANSQIAKELNQSRLPDVHLIGHALFTDYYMHLQVIGMILLVSTVGAVMISRRKKRDA